MDISTIFNPFRKCVFCRKRGGLEIVQDWYRGEKIWYRYHKACLDAVRSCPEKHTHKQVDMGVLIFDLLVEEHKKRLENDENHKEKIRQLKEYINLESGGVTTVATIRELLK